MDGVANNRAQCKCCCFPTKNTDTRARTHTQKKMSTRHLDVPISCYSTSYRVEFKASRKVRSCYADYEMSPELLTKVVGGAGGGGDISILARASLNASYTHKHTDVALASANSTLASSLVFCRQEERGEMGGIFPPLSSLSGLHFSYFFFFSSPPRKKMGRKTFSYASVRKASLLWSRAKCQNSALGILKVPR